MEEMDKMTERQISNLEAIIDSHLDNRIIGIILKDGKEVGGIVDEANDIYSEFTLVDGNGDYTTVRIEEVEKVYYY